MKNLEQLRSRITGLREQRDELLKTAQKVREKINEFPRFDEDLSGEQLTEKGTLVTQSEQLQHDISALNSEIEGLELIQEGAERLQEIVEQIDPLMPALDLAPAIVEQVATIVSQLTSAGMPVVEEFIDILGSLSVQVQLVVLKQIVKNKAALLDTKKELYKQQALTYKARYDALFGVGFGSDQAMHILLAKIQGPGSVLNSLNALSGIKPDITVRK